MRFPGPFKEVNVLATLSFKAEEGRTVESVHLEMEGYLAAHRGISLGDLLRGDKE